MRTRTFPVDRRTEGRTVQSVLRGELLLSDGLISRLKRRPRGILVNGEKAYTTRVLHAGDVLAAEVGDPPDTRRARPVRLPLDILYEDDDLLLLNKPAGITVHADSRRPDEVTLDHALSAHLPPDAFPHPVSRLDRGTTGIMTYAKSGYLHELLRRKLHTQDFFRTYLGIAAGIVLPREGVVELSIGFAPGSTYQRAIAQDGAPSKTTYTVLGEYDGLSLVRLIPHTGRTHQLRVHMAALGYPLVGDWLYGERDARIDRPALHSHTLHLVHPLTGEALDFTAPLPADMRALFPRFTE